jgi:hypothetical protein
MASLDQENVIDELAHSGEAPARLHRRFERGAMIGKSAAPLVALHVGVAHQFVKRQRE